MPPKLAHRPEEKLSSVKDKRSINKKLAPVMSFLQDFCNNEGVTLKNLIQLINEEGEPVKNKKQKTSIDIPVEEATSFFFNQQFSSRS